MRKDRLVEMGARIREKLGDRSLKDFAAGIDCKYEMARRYSLGISIPHDPKVLERIATYLNCSVGWLLAEEDDLTRQMPLVPAKDITEAVTQPTRMLIEDEAMLLVVDNIRLFGVGDQAILFPRRDPLPGDIVAVRYKDRTSLRKLTQGDGHAAYVPRKEGYATYTNVKLLGVVAGVYGKVARFE
ncbi:MAG: helix-turn-helix transcriptional regulator [Pseudomonadota bacterium]